MTEDFCTSNVKNIIENTRQSLFSILDSLEGEKTIVWGSIDVLRRIDQLIGVNRCISVLANHGVTKHIKNIKEFSQPQTPYILFFLSASMQSLDDFFEFIDQCEEDNGVLYEVVFIPGASFKVRTKLREVKEGKYWKRLEAVKDLPLWWLPADGYCLSLNEDDFPSRLLINHDWTILHRCAEALNELLTLCPGKVPCYSKGHYSEMLCNMVYSEKKTFNQEILPCKRVHLNRVIVIDRWLDPLTPLLTQLTYSGLLDELYGIESSTVKVRETEFEGNGENIPPESMKKIQLRTEFFQEISNVRIESWGEVLGKLTRELGQDEMKLNELKNTGSLAEVALSIKTKMPSILERKKYLPIFLRLAEMMMKLDTELSDLSKAEYRLLHGIGKYNERIQDLLRSWVKDNENEVPSFIEEAILEAEDLLKVLRLIGIHSLVSDGLNPLLLKNYRTLLWQSYGTEAVNKLIKMQKIGLIQEKGAVKGKTFNSTYIPFSFSQAKKNYALLKEEINSENLADPYYTYRGYSPLLLELIKRGEKSHWDGWTRHGEIGSYDDSKMAVFIIGGVTRSEMALMRQLSNISLILTTTTITGRSLIENLTQI